MYIYVSLCFFIIVKSVQNSRYYAFKKAGRLIIPEFTLVLRCSNQVVQGKYSATTLTVTGKHSNYHNMATEFKSPLITFKFSINGLDNEMLPDVNHEFVCLDVNCVTPVITFEA